MTVEELKEEANKLGYNIIPKTTYIPRKKCRCGSRPSVYFCNGGIIKRCNSCGLETKVCKNEKQAHIAWNELVDGVFQDDAK